MSQDAPPAGDPPTEDVYCPRCFTVVEDELVFCQECGQFIYAHAPADTRAWDSRTPEIPEPVITEPDEALRIVLPEESFPRARPVKQDAVDQAGDDDVPGDDASDASPSAPDGTDASETDNESV